MIHKFYYKDLTKHMEYEPGMFADTLEEKTVLDECLSSYFLSNIVDAEYLSDYVAVVLKDGGIITIDDEDYFYNNPDCPMNDTYEIEGIISEHSNMTISTMVFKNNKILFGSIKQIPCNHKILAIKINDSDCEKKSAPINYLSQDEIEFLTI